MGIRVDTPEVLRRNTVYVWLTTPTGTQGTQRLAFTFTRLNAGTSHSCIYRLYLFWTFGEKDQGAWFYMEQTPHAPITYQKPLIPTRCPHASRWGSQRFQ